MNDNFLEATTGKEIVPYLSGILDCPVCLGPHDEEMHSATLSVRRWFRDEVTKSFRIEPLV